MLPFLKKQVKHQSGLLIKHRPADETSEKPESSLDLHAKDLMHAIAAQDVKAIASALKAAFDCLEMEPHDEIEHTPEEPQE